MHKQDKGFTLIEVLVVISIIALLSSITLVYVNDIRAKARDAKRLSDLNQIRTALNLYYSGNGSYPILHDFHWYNAVYDGVWSGTPSDAWENVLGSALKPYIDPLPKDPINNRNHFTFNDLPFDNAYGYFYHTNIDGQEYELITVLEKNEQLQCKTKRYPILCVPGLDLMGWCKRGQYWCSPTLGAPPINLMNEIYSIGEFAPYGTP